MSTGINFNQQRVAISSMLDQQGQQPIDALTTLVCLLQHYHVAFRQLQSPGFGPLEFGPVALPSMMQSIATHARYGAKALSNPEGVAAAVFTVDPAWKDDDGAMANSLKMLADLLDDCVPACRTADQQPEDCQQASEKLSPAAECYLRGPLRKVAEQHKVQLEPPAFR